MTHKNGQHDSTAAVNKLAVGPPSPVTTTWHSPTQRRAHAVAAIVVRVTVVTGTCSWRSGPCVHSGAVCECHGGEKLFLTLPARADNCPFVVATISRRPSARQRSLPPTPLRTARQTLCVRFIFISFSLQTSYASRNRCR